MIKCIHRWCDTRVGLEEVIAAMFATALGGLVLTAVGAALFDLIARA